MNQFDLIICIFACDTIARYKQEILKINDTWGKMVNSYENIKMLFFLGETPTDLIGLNYINLQGVNNDYLSASHKQMLGLKHIKENYETKYVIVCGTDTYLNIKKLMIYIKCYNSDDNLYIGGHGDNRYIQNKKIYFHSGGPVFIITKGCLHH